MHSHNFATSALPTTTGKQDNISTILHTITTLHTMRGPHSKCMWSFHDSYMSLSTDLFYSEWAWYIWVAFGRFLKEIEAKVLKPGRNFVGVSQQSLQFSLPFYWELAPFPVQVSFIMMGQNTLKMCWTAEVVWIGGDKVTGSCTNQRQPTIFIPITITHYTE